MLNRANDDLRLFNTDRLEAVFLVKVCLQVLLEGLHPAMLLAIVPLFRSHYIHEKLSQLLQRK